MTMPLKEMFWGDYFGACTDKSGSTGSSATR